MPQTACRGLGIFACWLVASLVHAQTSDLLLPETTKGYLSISNAKQFNQQWKKTQLGQLMNDKVMEPFTKDLRRQLEDRLSNLRDRLGLTLDDIEDVPSGELAVAMVQPSPNEAVTVLLMDVSTTLKQFHPPS